MLCSQIRHVSILCTSKSCYDPTVTKMNDLYVPRTLFWVDDNGERQHLNESALAAQPGPVVVLAEPGGGKSELFRQVSAATGAPLVSASKWLRTARPETLVDSDRPIFIDALDEASARREGDAVQRVLAKLDAAGTPRFVLSCRAADWEARAVTGIAQDYQVAPLLCHLEPFTRTQACWLLGQLCPDHDPAVLVAHLESRGIGTLAASPLTLQLVAKVVQANGELPASRAALYDAAIRVLWAEHDADRVDDPLAHLTEAAALDAAGAVFAALLLSGRHAVTATGPGLAGPDVLSLHDLSGLADAADVRAVSGSKLFRSDEPGRLVPFHRTLAEY